MADVDEFLRAGQSANPTWYQRFFRSIGGNDDPTTKEFWTTPNPDIKRMAEEHQQGWFSQIPREYASSIITTIPGTLGFAGTVYDLATGAKQPSWLTRTYNDYVEKPVRDALGLPDEMTWPRVVGGTLAAATPVGYINPAASTVRQIGTAVALPFNFVRAGSEAKDVLTQGAIAGTLMGGSKLIHDAVVPPAQAAPTDAERFVSAGVPPPQQAQAPQTDVDRFVQQGVATPREEGDSYINDWKTYALGAAALGLGLYGANRIARGIAAGREARAGAVPRTEVPEFPDPQSVTSSLRTAGVDQNQYIRDVLDKGLTPMGEQVYAARGQTDMYQRWVDDIMNRIATRTGTGGSGLTEHVLATGNFPGTNIKMEVSPARLQSMAAALSPEDRTVLYDALRAGDILDQRRLYNQKLVQRGKMAIPDNVPWSRGMLPDKTTSELAQMYAAAFGDPQLAKIVTGYKDVMRKTLEYYAERGILTRDQVNGLLADRPNYVHRATDEKVEGFFNKMKQTFRSPEVDDKKMQTDLQSLLKRTDDTLKSAIDPFEAMDKQLHNAVHLAETNAIKRDIVAMATEHVTLANGTKVPLHKGSEWFEKVGTATDKAGNQLASAAPDEFLVRMGNGETTRYRSSLELASVMRFAPATAVPFMNAMRKFQQFMATGHGNPLFAGVSALYDIASSAVFTKVFENGKVNFIPGIDPIKGMGQAAYGRLLNEMTHQLYRQVDSNGVLSRVLGPQHVEKIAQTVQHMANKAVFNIAREVGLISHERNEAIWGRSVLNNVAPDVGIARNVTPVARYAVEAANLAWRGYTGLLSSIQEGTKLGYFSRHAGKSGMELTEAAAKARDITGDFSKTPLNTFVQKLESTVPYMRVGVIGADKFIRAWKANPYSVTAKGLGTVSVPMVGGAMMMTLTSPEHRDFYWNKLSPAQRAAGFWFPVGPDPTRSLFIPIEPVLGAVFGTTALATADMLFGMSTGELEGSPEMRTALAHAFNVPDDVARGAAFKPLTHKERTQNIGQMALETAARVNPLDMPTGFNVLQSLMGGKPASVRLALTGDSFFRSEGRPTAEGTRYEGGVFAERTYALVDGFFGLTGMSLLNALEAAHETKMYSGSTQAANERAAKEFSDRYIGSSPTRILFDLPTRMQSRTLSSENLKDSSDAVDKVHELFGKFVRNDPGIRSSRGPTTDAVAPSQYKTPEFVAIGNVVQNMKPRLDKIQSDISAMFQLKQRMEVSALSPGAYKTRADAINAQMRDITRRRQDAQDMVDAMEHAVSRALGGRKFSFRQLDLDAPDLGLGKMQD